LYTELFYAIIPTLFLCFLLICYPYIFNVFYSCCILAIAMFTGKHSMQLSPVSCWQNLYEFVFSTGGIDDAFLLFKPANRIEG